MSGSVRIALVSGALVLAAGSAATLRTAASPLQGSLLSISHQAGQDGASRGKPVSGQTIFRFDTFNDEQLWTNVLRMHEAIPSVNPVTALAVGLKVDVDALPPALLAALQAGQVDLTDPAVTIQLLRLNAVVGLIGKVDDRGQLTSIGTTCALCHSTVDNSFTTGIGKRLDGWPNRDLNVGAILGLSPALDPGLKTEFSKWGPGKYDPRHHVFDGTNTIPLPIPPDSPPTLPVLIPPAYGLQGVGLRPIRAMGQSPIGIATSVCRKWEGKAASTILASGSSSHKNRIASRRSCRPCSSINSVSPRRFLRAGALTLRRRDAASVYSTARPHARRVTSRRPIPMS